MERVSQLNTLTYDASLCTGCGMCSAVCPHGVFRQQDHVAVVVRPDVCIECGACELNCPAGAIQVQSGVGCASAMIWAALTRRPEATCGDVSASCSGVSALEATPEET
jgi:NAD-dependent dihydropyrimidine dehydrogenase PreA subunit